MNYRHVFHAGNFADLAKHAAVTSIMDRLIGQPEPLLVVDSHAGAGLYDLTSDPARKSGEAQMGIARLMADASAPQVFHALKAAMLKANPGGGLTVYPGSPVLIADRLRRGDAYIGAELRPDDFEALNRSLAASGGAGLGGSARAVRSDGFDLVANHAADPRRLFVLIDPPYERADDYRRTLDTVGFLLARPKPAAVLIWLPLKDLETFDSFLRRLEEHKPPSVLVVEARLRPLTDPMRLNGCALVLLGGPRDLDADLKAAAEWVATRTGGPGGLAKVWRLKG